MSMPKLNHNLLLALIVILASSVLAEDAIPSVPPEGVAPFDPKPLMDKLAQRITTDKYRFVVLGDSKHGIYFPNLVKLLDEELKPDFVLTTGDMVQVGGGATGPGYWEKLALDSGDEMRKRPWWPAIGNHEIAGSPMTTRRDLEDKDLLEKNKHSGVENFKRFYNIEREYYSFTFRNAVFIALPFENMKKETEKWLKQELEKAADEKKLIFVFNHAPFYTVGNKIDVPDEETRITKLFTKNGVRAVFSGHDHGYYRTLREGVTYCISAGAGARIYTALRLDEALPADVYYFGEPNAWRGKPLPEGTTVTELKPMPLLMSPERLNKYRPDERSKVGLELTADGAVQPLRAAATSMYVLHRPGKPDRFTTTPDLFAVVIDVDGDSVKMKCLSARGETFDEAELPKSGQ